MDMPPSSASLGFNHKRRCKSQKAGDGEMGDEIGVWAVSVGVLFLMCAPPIEPLKRFLNPDSPIASWTLSDRSNKAA